MRSLCDTLHSSVGEAWVSHTDLHKLGGPSALIECVSDHWVIEISKLLFFDRMPAVFLS